MSGSGLTKHNNNPVSFLYFGDELIRSEDLDPVYVALARANLDDALLKRMLLAYWCYYSMGTASRIAEAGGHKFFDMMWKAWAEKWPHGFERRHFYGESAKQSILFLQSQFNGYAERIVDDMTYHSTVHEIVEAVKRYRGFGVWMGWKIADMSERVLGYDVDFSDPVPVMYGDVIKGMALMYYGDKNHDIGVEERNLVVNALNKDFSHWTAPPWYDRQFNAQEGETVLCKYKAYFYGEYYIGKDIAEVSHGLSFAAKQGCDLAGHLLACMPELYKPVTKPYKYNGSWPHVSVRG